MRSKSYGWLIALSFVSSLVVATWLTASPTPVMTVSIDATDSARKLFHAELALPVHAGALTLVYPRWGIPTYALPAATIDNMIRLKITAEGRPLEWKRDLVDMFSFHVVVPESVTLLHVAMDVVAPTQRSDLNAATARLLVLDWYTLVLYPEGAGVDELPVDAQLRLPAGWKHGSAMASTASDSDVVKFARTTLRTLVDSPVIAGEYFHSWTMPSAPGQPPVYVDLAAETPEKTELPADWQTHFRRIVAEAGALFGGYPYEQYHFLVALSDELGNDGLEHRQSSDTRMSLRAFSDDASRLSYGYLIPHEYIHAWNGTFRMEAGLVRRDFQESQTTEMHWVYEGLTRYLNWVLAARSGLFSIEEARDYVALLGGQQAHRSGREWRSLQDTAISAAILNDSPDQWQSERRGSDYYDEALFVWLEADTIIRNVSKGDRSLDDFCRDFFAPRKERLAIAPYTFADVIAALNRAAPFDWKKFLRTRLDSTAPADDPPFDGLIASGWTLGYGDKPGSVQLARDKDRHTIEERFSLGFLLQEDGKIVDVVRDSPAWKAGLGPDMKVVGVNHLPWSADALHNAIAQRATAGVLSLSVENGSSTRDIELHDNRGGWYPKLKRNENADLMTEILRARSSSVKSP
ncbi:MAG: M61 family metallopeptidase [Chthoniobacterales bacterium]